MSYLPDSQRRTRSDIAQTTLKAVETGKFTVDGDVFDIADLVNKSVEETRLYGSDSTLSSWKTNIPSLTSSSSRSNSIILEISTLAGARLLATTRPDHKIGVLNFASAKKPGGGFLGGAQAQEESIARSSSLYPTLITPTTKPFYDTHRHDPKGGYYSHAMIYSPGVVCFRDDSGEWLKPIEVDVVTSPAVNAGTVRQTLYAELAGKSEEAKIERVMRERMARILYLFEKNGVRHLVLGSFGTGVFKNDVKTVARIWADLLGREGSRFEKSFERVVFAVLGKETFTKFEEAFDARRNETDAATPSDQSQRSPSIQSSS
ncbi:hypothetical protein BD410DRAFT_793713 [Rickenella mellea]|uniref:Microbial-type PARG catalytic domain-containing protein n=1 Tax=Rickenella mellea TaxID=50990 RepID=A0A4Y7PSH4_9AGAM|nr:hypothetical protein BD410DRAFT_793713 [Rickenella mellea]